jgi:hypothetical protein
LEELYASAKDTEDHAPVFATIERKCGRDGVMRPTGRPLSPRMVTRVFRRYADCAGLPESVRLHDLRHTAITNAIGQGEDILLIAAFAGHAKTSTTVDVYGHLMPDRVREAARRMRSVSGAPSPLETAATAPVQPTRPAAPFARRVDSTNPAPRVASTNPYQQARPSRAATVTMLLEHTTTQHQHTTEHHHTNHHQQHHTDRIQNYNDLHPRRSQRP